MCLAHEEGTGEVSTEKIGQFVDLGLKLPFGELFIKYVLLQS